MNQSGSWKTLSLVMIHSHNKSASLICISETWLDTKSEPHLQFSYCTKYHQEYSCNGPCRT